MRGAPWIFSIFWNSCTTGLLVYKSISSSSSSSSSLSSFSLNMPSLVRIHPCVSGKFQPVFATPIGDKYTCLSRYLLGCCSYCCCAISYLDCCFSLQYSGAEDAPIPWSFPLVPKWSVQLLVRPCRTQLLVQFSRYSNFPVVVRIRAHCPNASNQLSVVSHTGLLILTTWDIAFH